MHSSGALAIGMPANWWWAFPPALSILIIAISARMVQGGWLAPGAAWASFWAVETLVPLLVAPGYNVSPAALWIIAAFVCAVFIGSQLGLQNSSHRGTSPPPNSESRTMHVFTWIGLLAGFLMTGLTLVQFQSTWTVWLSPARLGALANSISVARYAGEGNESILVRFCLVLSYLGSLAGGHLMAWRKKKVPRWVSLGPLLGALSYALLTTAKAGLLVSALLWLAAWSAENLRRNGKPWRTSWRFFAVGCSAATCTVLIFVIAMMLRYGFEETEDRNFVIERLRNYSVSHLTAFSSWWDSDARKEQPLGWGRQSLFGPFALVTGSKRREGVYETLYSETYTIDSNLFTIYRSLIEDFSLPGALVLMVAIGHLASTAYSRLVRIPRSTLPATTLTIYYTMLGWSHIVNILGYTTVLIAFGAYAIISKVNVFPGLFDHRPGQSSRKL